MTFVRGLCIVTGMAWTLPNTLAGLLIGVAGMAAGARVRWRAPDLAIEFALFPWGPGQALTLGNCILHTGADLDVECGLYAPVPGCDPFARPRLTDHERAHVFQYMLLGPFFLPVYFACGGISARNPLERAADRYALTGRGWWPGLRGS